MESTELERTLDQGRLLELYVRQDLSDSLLLRTTLAAREKSHTQAANTAMKSADGVRNLEPQQALALDLMAQEDLAAARALHFVRDHLPKVNEADLAAPRSKLIGDRLASLGFAICSPDQEAVEQTSTDPPKTSSRWESLQHEIAKQHQRAFWLALCVLGFVTAMACLTVADVRRRAGRVRLLVISGVLLGVFATLGACRADHAIGRYFAVAALAFVILAAAGWITGILQAPENTDEALETPAIGREPPVPGGEMTSRRAHSGFASCAVLTITASVVFSAIVGVGFHKADMAARKAATEAAASGAEMLKHGSDLGRIRTLDVETIAFLLEQRAASAVNAAASQLLQTNHPRRPGASEAADKRMVGHDREALNWINDPIIGLQADRKFPTRFVAKLALQRNEAKPENGLKHNSFEPYGNWEAARTESVEAHERAINFLLVLTLLAVAIYLVSQAHGMIGGHAAFVLYGLGLVFAAIGVFLAISAEWSSSETAVSGAVSADCDATDRRASSSRHFAIGATYLAAEPDTISEYQTAIKALQCAVSLRPDFAEARRQLARAFAYANSSQRSERGYLNLPDPRALGQIIYLREKAIEQFKRKKLCPPPTLVSSLRFNEMLLALRDGDEARMDAAIVHAKEDLRRHDDPEHSQLPIRQLNLAIALLARGYSKEAADTYTSVLGAHPENERGLLSDITDLQVLRDLRCPPARNDFTCLLLRQDVDDRIHDIIKAITPSDAASTPAIVPDNLAVEASASQLTVRLEKQPNEKQVHLVLLWYGLDPNWQTWRVLTELSGPVRTSDMKNNGSSLTISKYLPLKRGTCVSEEKYRAEVYADAARVGQIELAARAAAMEVFRFPELNLILCAPATWKRKPQLVADAEAEGSRQLSLRDALVTTDDSPQWALYVRAFPGPRGTGKIEEELPEMLRKMGDVSSAKQVATREDCIAASRNNVLARAWRRDGMAYVAAARAGSASAEEICDMLVSANNYE
jgi:tetratricopeptide (TPR) repeat protein